jgi:hypothetical protein
MFGTMPSINSPISGQVAGLFFARSATAFPEIAADLVGGHWHAIFGSMP